MADVTHIQNAVEQYYNCIDINVKKQLEAQMESWKESPDIVDLAKKVILQESTTVMTRFYFLSVFEGKQLWNRKTFTDTQVIENRGYLWSLLTSGKFSNPFLINKLARIVIVFAKHEYPIHWPNFINDLYQLRQLSLNLSLIMIKTLAEVFFPKGKPIVPRLSLDIKILMPLIWNTLKWGYSEISGSTGHKFQKSPTKSSTGKQYLIPSPTDGTPSSPEQIRETVSSAFEALVELLDSHPSDSLFWNDQSIELLLLYCVADVPECEYAAPALAILAEILSLAQISPESSKYLPVLFSTLGNILDINVQQQNNLTDEYTSKTISLVNNCFSMHLKRILTLDSSSLYRNLELLYAFTFAQAEADNIFDCLQIWESLINNDVPKEFPLTKPLLLAFVQQTIGEYLIGKPTSGEVSEKALDIVTLLSELYPTECISLLTEKMTAQHNAFKQTPSDKNIISELISTMKIIGRITVLFEESFLETFSVAKSLIDTHLAILEQVYMIQNLSQSQLHLVSSTYSSLSLFLGWISQYRNKALEFSAQEETSCEELIQKLMVGAVEFMQKMQAGDNFVSPSRFLATITSSLKPNCMEIAVIHQMLMNLQTNRSLTPRISHNLWRFATNLFIHVSYGSRVHAKDWAVKAHQFRDYLAIPLQNLLDFFSIDMSQHPNPSEIRNDLIYSFQIMNAVFSATKDGSPQSREVAFLAVGDYFNLLSQYFPYFMNDNEGAVLIVEVLANGIETLKTQIAKSGKMDIISQSVYTLQSYMLQLHSQSHPSLELINYTFSIFSIIVQEKSKHFEPLLREMIIFCSHLNEKHGTLGEEELEIFTCLDSLVNQILRTHWTHFFGSKIQAKTTKYTTLERQQEFLVLFQIMAMSFAHDETDLIRQNLKNMLELNDQFSFFLTDLFKANVFMPLATGLLDILLSKRLELLEEEFTTAFLEVVCSDLPRFQSEFIPFYATQKGFDLTSSGIVDKETGYTFLGALLDTE